MTEKLSLEKKNELPFKSIEIPKEELKIVQNIFEFSDKISDEGWDEDSVYAYSNSKFTVEEIIERRTNELSATLNTLPEDKKFELQAKIQREAEYEKRKGDIDYENAQFKRLTQFIENQPIWKYKFSTNRPFQLGQYHEYNYKGDASESQKADSLYSYAGQGRDSIYYVSYSGLSLRLKKDLLMTNGLKKVLQKPQELILFFNKREQQRNDLKVNESFDDIEGFNSTDFPAEVISFEPKLGYNTEEFTKFDFFQDINSNYKSNIEVIRSNDRVIVKNYDNTHTGHQINKIYFQK